MTRTQLTPEQTAAIAAGAGGLFIEAHPGSGKTTVACERFGVRRFDPASRHDHRAIVATSFTKAATHELQQRIRTAWAGRTLVWPHRVVTIDYLLCELLESLLAQHYIEWPGGCRTLVVHDSWRSMASTKYCRSVPRARLEDGAVYTWSESVTQREAAPTLAVFEMNLAEGHCTHNEVRAVMEAALQDACLRRALADRLASTIRCLIVDEVFDANALDIGLVGLCLDAGVSTTMIGDPWQALYEFRGARPQEARRLTTRSDVKTAPLTNSFRWKSQEQHDLAAALRARKPVALPENPEASVSIVLAAQWKWLWDASERVLPTAFGSARHDLAYAGATMLLSRATEAAFGNSATFIQDARTTLGLATPELVHTAEQWADSMIERLAGDPDYDHKRAYLDMAAELGAIIGVPFPKPHSSREQYFQWLKPRLSSNIPLLAGITVHQAKGREWDTVGIVLSSSERKALAAGLDPDNEDHRRIYVACTRARWSTCQFADAG